MIDINNESGVDLDQKALLDLAVFALGELRIHPQADLDILMVDAGTMTTYHEKFLDLPGPTDVMSFPMDELRSPDEGEPAPIGLLGDIVLCPQVLVERAPENGRTPDQEAQYLLIHGLLHLRGYDQGEAGARAVRGALTDRILAEWDDQRSR